MACAVSTPTLWVPSSRTAPMKPSGPWRWICTRTSEAPRTSALALMTSIPSSHRQTACGAGPLGVHRGAARSVTPRDPSRREARASVLAASLPRAAAETIETLYAGVRRNWSGKSSSGIFRMCAITKLIARAWSSEVSRSWPLRAGGKANRNARRRSRVITKTPVPAWLGTSDGQEFQTPSCGRRQGRARGLAEQALEESGMPGSAVSPGGGRRAAEAAEDERAMGTGARGMVRWAVGDGLVAQERGARERDRGVPQASQSWGAD